MYLEKLEVQGFKSFANKNKLIFPGLISGEKRGLTSIVGPNGSGKSNVADAIRWALGEQSLKLLRGKKSEDVIFSGSDKKHQLGFAEVSLYLNNSLKTKKKPHTQKDEDPSETEKTEKNNDLDKIISSYEEIVITRRLYRSGESEYLINNNRVRLSDIQMLLAKANFGQKTYSVIGQGMVENFLTSSAGERKDFFDEATGVKQFQIKRDSALNKLENSYTNLRQVEMLLTEIRPRLKSLTRQVDKLKKRDEIENSLKSSQLSYYGTIWKEINQKLDSANREILSGESWCLEENKKLQHLNDELDKIRRSSDWSEISDLQSRLQELNIQKGQQQKHLARLQAELELKLEAQGKFDLSWLNGKQAELKTELENVQGEIAAAEKNDFSKRFSGLKQDIELIDKKLGELEKEKRALQELNDEKTVCQNRLNKLEAILEANLEARGQYDVSWLKRKQSELTDSLQKTEDTINQIEEEERSSKLDALNEDLAEKQKKIDSLNAQLTDINRQIKDSKSQKEGEADEINALIEDFLKQLDDISLENDLTKIKELIAQAKRGFEKNIKKILGGRDDAALQKLKDTQAEIISLTEERQNISTKLNEERSRIDSLKERKRLLTERREQTASELSEIKDKLNQSQTEFDSKQIDLEKDQLYKKISDIDNRLRQSDYNEKSRELDRQRQNLVDQQQDLRVQESSLQERLRLLSSREQQAKQALRDIESKIAAAQDKPDLAGHDAKKEEIGSKIDEINQSIKKLSDKLDQLNQAKDEQKNKIFEYQKNLQDLQQKINERESSLNQIRVEAARQETKLEDLENNIREDELPLNDIKHSEPEDISREELESLAKSISHLKNQLEMIGGIDPEAEDEYTQTKERFDFLEGQTIDLKKAIKSLEEIIYELDKNIKDRFDSEFKVIAEKFNEYFKILFNGGNAKIYKLTNEDKENGNQTANNGSSKTSETLNESSGTDLQPEIDDKLKNIKFLKKHNAADLAGIEIQATPPGKKIQTVSMLSGGERALTAIALICAIISANPSPFVVLDEVDAALDEANSERLAKILDDLSNKTQFIVITHNRAAMRRASILYGVTMEADGVSKLLSVKLDEVETQ